LTGGGGKHPPKTVRGLAQHWASRSFSSVVGKLHSLAEENFSMYQFFKLDLQPTLGGKRITVRPLEPQDFENLFAVASDPLIWSQHPDPGRGTREGFPPVFRRRSGVKERLRSEWNISLFRAVPLLLRPTKGAGRTTPCVSIDFSESKSENYPWRECMF
jgi:hypothetical protein